MQGLTLRSLCTAFIPLVALIGMIVLGVTVFGRDVGDGPSQVSLVFATAIATVAYLPFCFFNLISPLMSICIAAIGWKIVHPRASKEE